MPRINGFSGFLSLDFAKQKQQKSTSKHRSSIVRPWSTAVVVRVGFWHSVASERPFSTRSPAPTLNPKPQTLNPNSTILMLRGRGTTKGARPVSRSPRNRHRSLSLLKPRRRNPKLQFLLALLAQKHRFSRKPFKNARSRAALWSCAVGGQVKGAELSSNPTRNVG